MIRKLEDMDRQQWEPLEAIHRKVSAKEALSDADLRRLRLTLSGLRDDAFATDVLPQIVFDDLIGDFGFKVPFLENAYRASLDEGVPMTASGRKQWLRGLDPNVEFQARLRNLVSTALGRTVAEIELLDVARFPNREAALARYVELLTPPSAVGTQIRTGFEGIARSEIERLHALRGPNGMGLDFDYERFPVESLTPETADAFKPGMPVNWPVRKTVEVTETASGTKRTLDLGVEVPEYRTGAARGGGSSRYMGSAGRLEWSANDRFRWRAWGNIFQFEKAKRLLDTRRATNARKVTASPDMTALMQMPLDKIAMNQLDNGYLPSGGTKDIFAPIAEIPNEILDYQLLRHRLLPTTPRGAIAPRAGRASHEVLELDHDFGLTDILYHRDREIIALGLPDPDVAGMGRTPAVRVADSPAKSAA